MSHLSIPQSEKLPSKRGCFVTEPGTVTTAAARRTRSVHRPRHASPAAFLTLTVAVFLVSATPAFASPISPFGFSTDIGSAGSGAGQLSLTSGIFGLTSGIAVNDATGDLYIADTNNNRVDEFDPSKPPSEQFIRAWGWGVRNGAEELQICTESTGCQSGLPGTEPGQLEHATVIYVDNTCSVHRPEPLTGAACEALDPSSGDVYVASGNYGDPHPLVTKFSSGGALIKIVGRLKPQWRVSPRTAGRLRWARHGQRRSR